MSTKERKHPAPPRYDEAFKAGAVRMVTEQGRPSREVAAELGICIDTLRSWLKAAGAPSPGQADRQNRDARRLRELEAEIRALDVYKRQDHRRSGLCPTPREQH